MSQKKIFEASPESKAKAKQLRLFAILSWLIAMAGQVFAILKLIHDETLVWLIVAIVVILALAITGSLLWKKANKLDPASEQQKVKFFIQNQLGAIMGVLAFLPLVIFIFMNKDASKKTKGVAGSIAVVALLVAGIVGIEFDPASIEKYTEQINQQTDLVEQLNNGNNHVYWTPSGNKLHLYDDCHTIKNSNVSDGTVKQAWEARGIDNNEVCQFCMNRSAKEKELNLDEILNNVSSDIIEE